MDGMVDENGTPATDPLAPSPDPPIIVSSVGLSSINSPNQPPHLVTATNIVHLTLPTHASAQVQSVIQPNQQSVIQTATNLQQLQCKGNVILVGKPNSVIQTAQGSLQTLQVVETASDDSCYSEDESPKKRRDLLTRRPSYRKILNELGGGEIADNRAAVAAAASAATIVGSRTSGGGPATTTTTSTIAVVPIGSTPRRHLITNNNHGSATTMVFTTKMEQTSEGDSELDEGDGSLSSLAHSIPYHAVIPAGSIQISSGEGGQGIHTLTMTNSGASGAIVQYAQGQEFFVPVVAQSGSLSSGGGSGGGDGESRKQLRLLKNREAARECRRKKKEYIKCLENRVAVLENQNKALIDELKTLKELYCQQKVE